MADSIETNKKNQEQPSSTGKPEPITWENLDEFFTEKTKGVFDATTNLDRKLEELKGRLPDLDNRVKRVEDKIEDTRTNIIETIGILIGLFTFISIEFQIFKSEFSLQEAGGLTMIILGGMLLFITTIDFFIKLDLPLFKTERTPSKYSTLDLFAHFSKELTGEARTTLSGGFWIRLVFFIFSVALIICGVVIFSTFNKAVPTNQGTSDTEKQESSVKTYEDKLSLPEEIQKPAEGSLDQ